MSVLDAFQATLAVEHAAIYLYGVLGGRTSGEAQPDLFNALTDAYDAHVAARDALIARVVALGGRPVGSAPAYALPGGIGSPKGVRAAALALERRCAAAYLTQVPATTGDDRRLMVTSVGQAAVRELTFGGAPETFPGSS